MEKAALFKEIQTKESYLCVGLDTDLTKIPRHILKEKDPIFEFNKQIIDATEKYCVAYKPNTAFYEALGSRGWESLEKTIEYIPKNCFTIADAKRGDIGNTSNLYAKAFFEKMSFDAVTVAPYMGYDSVSPFLGFQGKWVILLALTSNDGSKDFQDLKLEEGKEQLFERVIKASSSWATNEQMMYVVGATKAEMLIKIRSIIPQHFLLVPGVGAQGGSLEEVSKYGLTNECGLLVNSSRGIIYASSGDDFQKSAGKEAANIANEMKTYLNQFIK